MNLNPLHHTVREAVLDALALVLPVECAGCGAPDRPVCADCRPRLTPDATSRLLSDGTRAFSGLDYEGVTRAVILAYKEDGRVGLARYLSPALAAAVEAASEWIAEDGVAAASASRIEVVAVPTSRRSRRRRGFDPVVGLVARAGLERAQVFAPARPHAAQKTLAIEQRASNLSDAFTLRVPVAGRRFLLIDDVVTTGSTLVAAASALRSAGAEVVAAAAVASTPRLFVNAERIHQRPPAAFP